MYNTIYIRHNFTIYVIVCQYVKFFAKMTFRKMCATFWGGVEVACTTLLKGHAILPQAVRFPATALSRHCYSLFREQLN